MSQTQKPPFWYRLLHPLPPTTLPVSLPADKSGLTEVKVITDNDLKIETILIEEFKFRGDSIKQVSSEFTSTLNLYFIFIGISASGFGIIYQLSSGAHNDLQLVVALTLLAFGIINILFFVRMITIIQSIVRDEACMNLVRTYYIEHLQSQIPDIRSAFRIPLTARDEKQYHSIIYSIFAVVDSFCFAGAAFVFTEIWLHINTVSVFPLLPLPTDVRPYLIALFIGAVFLLSQFVYFRITINRYFYEYNRKYEQKQ